MTKELELIRVLINGANEYEKETGNKNPTVYLSRNNLLVIEKALLKAQEPKQYVDELKLVEKKLKALEIIKENECDMRWLKYCIKGNLEVETYNNGLPEYYEKLTEEEFDTLKGILNDEQ